MSIKFLSPEYMTEAIRSLNADEELRSSVGDLALAIQLVVTDPSDQDDFSCFIRIENGGIEMRQAPFRFRGAG